MIISSTFPNQSEISDGNGWWFCSIVSHTLVKKLKTKINTSFIGDNGQNKPSMSNGSHIEHFESIGIEINKETKNRGYYY